MNKVKICKKCSSIDADSLKDSLKDSDVRLSYGCIGQCGAHNNDSKFKAKFNGNIIESDTQEGLSEQIKNTAASNTRRQPNNRKSAKKGKLTKTLLILAVLTLAIYYIAKLLFPNKEVGNEEKLN